MIYMCIFCFIMVLEYESIYSTIKLISGLKTNKLKFLEINRVVNLSTRKVYKTGKIPQTNNNPEL